MSRTWKIGAVARTSGLTVRTLHHWDEIGVLRPSRRGAGGHREYTEDDLARLHLVLALRDFGLGLESIRTCLDAGVDPRRLLVDQLADLDRGLRALGRLRDRVAQVVDADLPTVADPAELLSLMRDARGDVGGVLGRHLDDDQRKALAEGAKAAGPALPYLLEVEWPQLYRRVDELRRSGATPADDRVQGMVARLDELSAMLSSGDHEVAAGVRAAWREDPGGMAGEPDEVAAPWRDLAAFVAEARVASGGSGGGR